MKCFRHFLPRPLGFRAASASAFLALPASFLLAPSAQAANLTWDPSATGTGSDGSGTWNNTTPALFSNGASDVTYTPLVTASTSAATTSGTNTITVSPANAALLVVGQAVSSTAFAAGTTISSINTVTGVVTMSANATAAINNNTLLAFAPVDSVIFGKGTGAAGTVAVTGTQGANAMTVNAAGSGAYTFSGGTITLGANNNGTNGVLTLNAAGATTTINSAFNNKGITFTAANQTLKLGGGSSTAANSVVLFNSGGTISGTSTNGLTSTVELTAGTYTQGGAAGSYNIGNVATGTGGLIIDAGATVNSAVTFQAGSAGLITLNGGTMNQTGSSNFVVGRGGVGRLILNSGALNSTSTGSLLVGFQNGTGTADINGGALNVTGTLALNSPGNTPNVTGGTATVNITGTSVAKVGTINFGKAPDFTGTATSGTGTLNVKGGALYVGAGGIVKTGTGTYTATINLSGGTVGASANWSSALDVNLSNADGGVTFKTADSANVAHDISLSGKLTGTGGFTIAGGSGTLNITGTTNDYTGATTVNGGRLAIGANNALSTTSNVSLGGGTLGFATGNFSQGSSSTAGLGALTLNSTSVIDFAGGDDLLHFAASNGQTWTGTLSIYNWTGGADALYFGTDNTALTGAQLSQITFYSDNGTTLIGTAAWAGSNGGLTAVPEPKDWALMSLGLCALLVIKRRQRMMSAA